jgi:hypothetical protein
MMFKPGLIVMTGGMMLALSGCGIFDSVDSVVKNLSGAADKNEGSYRQPLAIPPDYSLRPPPNRPANKVAPAAKRSSKEKTPEKVDTEPATAGKTETPKEAKKSPRKLDITVQDKPKVTGKKVPAKKVTATKKTTTDKKVRRVVVAAPPQPSENTGKVRPETRGKEETSTTAPSKGEDELLRRSGVKQ